MTLPARPVASDVHLYRNEHECGLTEAVNAVSKQWRRDCVTDIRSRVSQGHQHDVIIDMLELLETLVERGP